MGRIDKRLTAMSLFSGAGGMDLGVRQAGFHNVCSVEIDKHCASTLRRNGASLVVEQDIRDVDPSELLDSLGKRAGEIDLLHGGPPCQPFSQIGLNSGLDHKDGGMLFEFLRFVSAVRPKAVLCEQVEGLLKHRTVFDRFVRGLRARGYSVSYTVINATAVGIPQARKRVFIVAFHKSVRPAHFEFGALTMQANTMCAEDVLEDLADVSTQSKIENHIDCTPDRDKERISYVGEGSWLSKTKAPKSIIKNLKPKDTTKYRRLDRKFPSLTLRCGEIFYHYEQDRYLTPRECMRLHGYPDRYVLEGPIRRRTGTVSNLDQHRQVANSVPPPLAKHIARQIRAVICT